MHMYQWILIPVDGSRASDRALQEAISLARDLGSRVRIIHVIENPYAYDLEGVDLAAIERARRQAGEKILDHAVAKARADGIEPEGALLEAPNIPIAQAVVDEAKRWGASLIIAGTHGRHGIEHMLLGSTAEGIVRLASVPVLLVREADDQ